MGRARGRIHSATEDRLNEWNCIVENYFAIQNISRKYVVLCTILQISLRVQGRNTLEKRHRTEISLAWK